MISLLAILSLVHGEAVQYRHGDVVLEGYLAYDKSATGRRPGVIVVHEWKGHGDYVRRRADALAKLGYIAFAIDMYGKGVYAKDHQEAGKLSGMYFNDRKLMRERAKAGLDVLARHELCDPRRIAAIGYCFGGTTVLEMARAGFDLRGVASFHGKLVTPNADDARHIKGSVLVFHGASDTFIPDAEVRGFQQEMTAAKVDWQLVLFGNAVHSFTVPEAGNDPSKGMAYDEKADRRSWEMLKGFFGEVLK